MRLHSKREAGDKLPSFDLKYINATPEKFQFILFVNENTASLLSRPITTLQRQKVFKLLGVPVDFKLKFNKYLSVSCSDAIRQMKVLTRLSKMLDKLKS